VPRRFFLYANPLSPHIQKIAKQKDKTTTLFGNTALTFRCKRERDWYLVQEKPTAADEPVALGSGGWVHNRSRDLAETANLEKR
jgi:hypothetical protein